MSLDVPRLDHAEDPFIRGSDIMRSAALLGHTLNDYFAERDEVIGVTIMDGGSPFSVDLTHTFTHPGLIPDRLQARRDSVTYDNGSQREMINMTVHPMQAFKERHVLLIDSSRRSGNTINAMAQRVHGQGPASLAVAIMFDALQGSTEGLPKDTKLFVGIPIADCDVLGYGHADKSGRYRAARFLIKAQRTEDGDLVPITAPPTS